MTNETFYGLESLLELDLNDNQLTTIEALTFDHSPMLKIVKMERNSILTLHGEWYMKTSFLQSTVEHALLLR